MKRFAIVENKIIQDIILVDDAPTAALFGAVPFLETLKIGDEYLPPDLSQATAEKRSDKLSEISAACNTTICAGVDVTFPDGTTRHYAMTETDQINMASALSAVQSGMAAFPYHADGELCRMYSAEDIALIVTTATNHKIYHTTYCNHLNVWIRRETDIDVLRNIVYGVELPADLAENMAALLATMGV